MKSKAVFGATREFSRWKLIGWRGPVFLGAAWCFLSCADLTAPNQNEPDVDRVRSGSNPGDVVALFASSFNTWFNGVYAIAGPGTSLSNAAFQNNGVWANNGEELYGRIPRVGLVNDLTTPFHSNVVRVWNWAYRANAAVSDGLRALEGTGISSELGPEETIRLRAFGKFVQGLCHATIALVYDRGFVADETMDPDEPRIPLSYEALMASAFGYFDEAIALAGSAEFMIPFEWMQADLSSTDLARLAHSHKARFRAQVARTPEEREAVDWGAVIADVDAGIRSDFEMYMDWKLGWEKQTLGYSSWPTGSSLTYFVYGMADQGGDVAEWLNLPLGEKLHLLPDGRPVLIVTPDLRFPQGETVEEQRATPGTHFRIMEASEEGNTWKNAARGTWRWSWYKAGSDRGLNYALDIDIDQPEISLAEMRLLKAEGLFRTGELAGAAELINETRVAAGLNPTDAMGTNTSCVPRLPNGSCGDLWEMLKWERRVETFLTGVAGANWYFDARGWGDLWKDTPLHFPVPCEELAVLQMTPCNHIGGPGGEMGSSGSTYNFPWEG